MHSTFVQPFWEQLAKGIAGQFGENCEVVIHDLSKDPEHSIVFIENGHVTGRSAGEGTSKVVLEALRKKPDELHDRINYLTEPQNGKILKSSTIFIRDNSNNVGGILGINYDITNFIMMDHAIKGLLSANEVEKPEKISNSVHGLLEELIEQSVRLVGKPVSQMNREDKIRAVQFLYDEGAFLITKSSDRVSKHFGISKYTLYNYIDQKDEGEIVPKDTERN